MLIHIACVLTDRWFRLSIKHQGLEMLMLRENVSSCFFTKIMRLGCCTVVAVVISFVVDIMTTCHFIFFNRVYFIICIALIFSVLILLH